MTKKYTRIECLNAKRGSLMRQLAVLSEAINELGVRVLEGAVELEKARTLYNSLKVEQAKVQSDYEDNERERKVEVNKLNGE